jgi:hypothetical protein
MFVCFLPWHSSDLDEERPDFNGPIGPYRSIVCPAHDVRVLGETPSDGDSHQGQRSGRGWVRVFNCSRTQKGKLASFTVRQPALFGTVAKRCREGAALRPLLRTAGASSPRLFRHDRCRNFSLTSPHHRVLPAHSFRPRSPASPFSGRNDSHLFSSDRISTFGKRSHFRYQPHIGHKFRQQRCTIVLSPHKCKR